jgi:hypothetical protein
MLTKSIRSQDVRTNRSVLQLAGQTQNRTDTLALYRRALIPPPKISAQKIAFEDPVTAPIGPHQQQTSSWIGTTQHHDARSAMVTLADSSEYTWSQTTWHTSNQEVEDWPASPFVCQHRARQKAMLQSCDATGNLTGK